MPDSFDEGDECSKNDSQSMNQSTEAFALFEEPRIKENGSSQMNIKPQDEHYFQAQQAPILECLSCIFVGLGNGSTDVEAGQYTQHNMCSEEAKHRNVTQCKHA